MGIISKQILDKQTLKFRALLEKERLFGQYPASLKLLKESALGQLGDISGTLISQIKPLIDFDIEDIRLVRNFIKNNPRLAAILKFADRELHDDIVSELLIRCENANQGEDVEDFANFEFYSEITDKAISAANDLLSKINEFNTSGREFIDSNMKYIEAGVMAYYVIRLFIDLIERTDFPSTFRLKYIQKILRFTLSSIWDFTKDQYTQIKTWLTTIDNLMVVLAAAGTFYLLNRKESQKLAIDLMLENACDKIKNSYEEGVRQSQIEPSTSQFEISLACPIQDTNFVPKEPYANKLENFSCPIDTEVDAITAPELDSQIGIELASKAKIVNKRDQELSVKVEKEKFVTTQTLIATIGDTPVYSPVEGYMESYNTKEIVISDISDPTEDALMKSINELNQKYRQINEIKNILKDYEIKCLYPIMLKESPVSDGKLSISEANKVRYENMEEQYNKISEEWYGRKRKKGLIEDYEKRVEKITSEKNVEKHAKNDETYKIKEELDKEENKLIKFLLKADEEGVKLARMTVAYNGEYELLEYYFNNIALELNEEAIEDKEEDKREFLPEFRKHINDYVRQRYVIEAWKPEKISDKAIELLKDLERGATNGSKLWKTGLEKYNQRKKFSDVKDWLEKEIKPKRKLESNEVESLINRIFFLYRFFLDIESFTADYKNLKESTPKEQTNKEGKYLLKFFRDLQSKYRRLPSEISRLEKRIEDLSLLSNYYDQTIDKTPYRIYTINAEDDGCVSEYAKDTASKYQLNDIRYWLKWCGYATLTGVFSGVPLPSPINNWAVGLFAPAPIALPVVYIPIKPVSTKYGIILFGLTVTGIYPFPMVLFTNQSSNYSSIISLGIIDKIKEEIDKIKDKVIEQLSEFTKTVLKEKLDQLTEEINSLNDEIDSFTEQIFTLKVNRPPKTRANIEEYNVWAERKDNIEKQKNELEVNRWKKEETHQFVNNAYNSGDSLEGSSDPAINSLKKVEESINNKLDNIISQIDELENTLRPLPTTLDPYSANFGFTLKNPKPVIEIADKLDSNINEGLVSKLTQPFQLSNEDFMKGPVKFNKTGYDVVLKASRWTMIQKDAFPKYEEIGVVNLPFLKFLTTEFLPKGAQTYGIPGQMPVPTG